MSTSCTNLMFDEQTHPSTPCYADAQPITFDVRDDGVITVRKFPDVAAFSDRFLAMAPDTHVSQGDGIVTIRVANGSASYGLVRRDEYRQCSVGIRSCQT